MLNINKMPSKNAKPICCCEKKRMFQPTFITALSTNKAIINPKFLCDECLFQIIRRDKEAKVKITVQATIIKVFEGVQEGRLIVLYHAFPQSAKYEAADPVIITNNGMNR